MTKILMKRMKKREWEIEWVKLNFEFELW
jgi:hypothetical protein